MNTKTLKFASAFLATSLLITPISSLVSQNNNNFAKANNTNQQNNNEELLKPENYGTHYINEDGYETRAGGTWLIKKAIKLVLNNKYKAANAVEHIAGKKSKDLFLQSFHKIEPQLKELLRWGDIPVQAVQDAVYRGMINAGVSSHYATKTAHAIKVAIGWLL